MDAVNTNWRENKKEYKIKTEFEGAISFANKIKVWVHVA